MAERPTIVTKLGRALLVVIASTSGCGHAKHPDDPWRDLDLPDCDGFDFPVGAPDGRGYYDAQPFGTNDHTGNDWNGTGGGNSDLGDPVYAAASGLVVEATDHGGGWGNVVRIVHAGHVESLYAHLDRIDATPGTTIHRGDRVGTIGTAGGQYLAHLHFEIRDRPMPLGGGYDADRTGYLDATAYIRAHRPAGYGRAAWAASGSIDDSTAAP